MIFAKHCWALHYLHLVTIHSTVTYAKHSLVIRYLHELTNYSTVTRAKHNQAFILGTTQPVCEYLITPSSVMFAEHIQVSN